MGQRTLPTQETIDRSKRWIISRGWGLVGNETEDELSKLNEAFNEASIFLASMMCGIEPYWLTLTGNSGTGKSMLARAVAKYITEYGFAIYRDTVAKELDASNPRRSFSYAQEGASFCRWSEINPLDASSREYHDRACSDWFKVIDELKPENPEHFTNTDTGISGFRPKPYEANSMGNLAEKRLRKWTIFTSNYQRKAIASLWDVRIASRLTRDGSIVVDMTGVRDFEIRKSKI